MSYSSSLNCVLHLYYIPCFSRRKDGHDNGNAAHLTFWGTWPRETGKVYVSMRMASFNAVMFNPEGQRIFLSSSELYYFVESVTLRHVATGETPI